MVSEAPPFWWTKADWRAWALQPFSWVYGSVARARMDKGKRAAISVPVICVGNFTVGGAGKTPTALALIEAARAKGLNPGILSRGYGGSIETTTLVDPHHHRARDVGDEPMLLAARAPTVIARDRVDGAARLIAEGIDFLIMDDGFQSAHIDHDYALLVIDAARGLGNGHIIPGGPVRAPVVDQLRHANALLKIGDGDGAATTIRLAARAGKPIYEARLVAHEPERLAGHRVLAFAGIADPDKFFRTLEATGADIVHKKRFGDHHPFSAEEASDLLALADREDLAIVSTAKDIVRLGGGHGAAARLMERALVLDVDLVFDPKTVAGSIIDKTIDRFKAKKLKAGGKNRR